MNQPAKTLLLWKQDNATEKKIFEEELWIADCRNKEYAAYIVKAVNEHAGLVAACSAGARYSNALEEMQDNGKFGVTVTGDELDRLFKDWHDKTHKVLTEIGDV